MNNRNKFQDEGSLKLLISRIDIAEDVIKREINKKRFADKIELLLQSCSFSKLDAIAAALTVSMDAVCLLYMFNTGLKQIPRDFFLSVASFGTLLNLGTAAILNLNKSVFYNQPINSLNESYIAARLLMNNLPDDIPELKEMNFFTPIYVFLERIDLLRHAAKSTLEDLAKQQFRQSLQHFGFNFKSPNMVVYDPENPHLKEFLNKVNNPQPKR